MDCIIPFGQRDDLCLINRSAIQLLKYNNHWVSMLWRLTEIFHVFIWFPISLLFGEITQFYIQWTTNTLVPLNPISANFKGLEKNSHVNLMSLLSESVFVGFYCISLYKATDICCYSDRFMCNWFSIIFVPMCITVLVLWFWQRKLRHLILNFFICLHFLNHIKILLKDF